LVLVGDLVDVPATGLAFELLLHAGTLMAVIWYYRVDLLGIARSVPDVFRSPRVAWQEDGPGRLALLIIVASIPTAVIGLAFKDYFEGLAESISAVGAALFITAILLALTLRSWPERGRIGVGLALVIGFAQGLAITPGISRSGATIAVALIAGIAADRSARFSFLVSLPAILGALVLKVLDGGMAQLDLGPGLIGFLVSIVSGYLALAWLVQLVRRQRFFWFAPYCALVGLWALLRGGGFAG
jgi:undecaprenyl-diphosphatase